MAGLNGDLAGVVEDLKRLHWAAENRVSEAQALYEQAKAERDHIARMLKVAGVQMEEPKPQKAKPKARPQRVNAETRAAVLAAIRHADTYEQAVIPGVSGSFTVTSLAERVEGVHHSSVRTAIHMLRDEGIIRAVGLVPNSPRQPPMAYALGEGNENSE